MPSSLIAAARAGATPFVIFASAATFFATGEVITAFRLTGDLPGLGTFYLVAIVMPWGFLFTRRRNGVEERVAATPLVVGLFSVHMACDIIERFARGPEASSGFPWGDVTFFTLMLGSLLLGTPRSRAESREHAS